MLLASFGTRCAISCKKMSELKVLLDVTRVQLDEHLLSCGSESNMLKPESWVIWASLDYNQLKLAILQAISKRWPLDSTGVSRELSAKGLAIDIHALRMALMRYYKLGLLKRERRGGVFVYSLSERGVQRLHWLESS
jgi:DNA-binding transcriptional ArsR family regulator